MSGEERRMEEVLSEFPGKVLSHRFVGGRMVVEGHYGTTVSASSAEELREKMKSLP